MNQKTENHNNSPFEPDPLEMILVDDLKYYIVPGPEAMIEKLQDSPNDPVYRSDYPEHCEFKDYVEIKQELIKGTIFNKPDGTKICIGFSTQASEILGISYEAFENQNRMLNDLHHTTRCEITLRRKQTSVITDYNKLSRWEKIKAAFKNKELIDHEQPNHS